MDVLILGGTAWLGRVVAEQAVTAGHSVTCLARGESGPPPVGVEHVRADRSDASAYDSVGRRSWDWVVEVSWQPRWVREALAALASRAAHWTYVSSGNVYARHDSVGADESASLLTATDADRATTDLYGEAKVACENFTRGAIGQRMLIARAGLIGGPGDISGRSGYWVARAARDPLAPMLIPDTPDVPTQVVDVRDLARWLVASAEARLVGTFNAVGPVVPFGHWIDLARAAAGHTGPVIPAPAQWLLDHGVAQYMGAESLPMWMVEPSYAGWSARSGEAAAQAGLSHRPRAALQHDVLQWEQSQGLNRSRRCGLSTDKELQLLQELAAA